MKKFIIIACLVVSFIGVQGCKKKAPELKSPCVGVEGSPCGPRKPVNDWWLKGEDAVV